MIYILPCCRVLRTFWLLPPLLLHSQHLCQKRHGRKSPVHCSVDQTGGMQWSGLEGWLQRDKLPYYCAHLLHAYCSMSLLLSQTSQLLSCTFCLGLF